MFSLFKFFAHFAPHETLLKIRANFPRISNFSKDFILQIKISFEMSFYLLRPRKYVPHLFFRIIGTLINSVVEPDLSGRIGIILASPDP